MQMQQNTITIVIQHLILICIYDNCADNGGIFMVRVALKSMRAKEDSICIFGSSYVNNRIIC